MKNNNMSIKTKALQLVSKVAKKEASDLANVNCVIFAYQPRFPEAAKKLRKF